MGKYTKLIISAAFVAIMAMVSPLSMNAQSEKTAIGVKAGYASKNHGAMIGAFYQRTITDHFRISPEVGWILRNEELNAFLADVNLHLPLNLVENTCSLYPLGGLNFTSWTVHGLKHEEYGSVSKSYSRFGLNLGAGFEVFPKSNFKIRVEWKYTLTHKYSTAMLDGGIGFYF